MTILETILIIALIAVVILFIYYYFKGAKGKVSLMRPVESRVDEYLDRRFESLVTEWALIRTPEVNHFKEAHGPQLEKNEAIVADLDGFDKEISSTLGRLEERLDAVEKELVQAGKA